MNFEIIMNKLNTIIKNELELGMHEALEKDTQLLAIGIDSIALMSLLVYIEEEFDFESGEDALLGDKFHTIGDVATYILSKIS